VSDLLRHAMRELDAIGMKADDESDYNKNGRKVILDLIELFSSQGHSGFSANYVIGTFEKLARFEPLGPLTGEDSEWNEVDEGVWQNNRCGHVFKQADRFNGQAYDIQGKVFKDPDGGHFTNSDSFTPVTFPYTPVSEIVEQKGAENG